MCSSTQATGLAMGSSRLVPALWALATVVDVVEPLPRSAARKIVTGLPFVTGDVRGQDRSRRDPGGGNELIVEPSTPGRGGARGGSPPPPRSGCRSA